MGGLEFVRTFRPEQQRPERLRKAAGERAFRGKHAESAGVVAEAYFLKTTKPLSVNFDRKVDVGAYHERFGLEVIDGREQVDTAECQAAQGIEHEPVTRFLVHQHIKFGVLVVRLAEKPELPSVKGSISGEHRNALMNATIRGRYFEGGRRLAKDPHSREQVGQRTKEFFRLPGSLFDHAGIESDPGHLDERETVGLEKVDFPDGTAVDDGKRLIQGIGGDVHFPGEDIHGSGRNDPEDGRGPGQSAHHFVERAIATGSNDNRLAGRSKLFGKFAGLSGMAGCVEGEAIRVVHQEAQHPSTPLAAGLGVEDQGIAPERCHGGIIRQNPQAGNSKHAERPESQGKLYRTQPLATRGLSMGNSRLPAQDICALLGSMHQEILLTRDVAAIQIPSGDSLILPMGTAVFITQRLGGTYTVATSQGLARISSQDADALGIQPEDERKKFEEAERLKDAPLEEQVWNQLKQVYDPEIPVDIVNLGLVYDCSIDEVDGNQVVAVKMTLTAPGCGMGPVIAADAQARIMTIEGIDDAKVELVWDPAWNQDMISEEGKMKLGMI